MSYVILPSMTSDYVAPDRLGRLVQRLRSPAFRLGALASAAYFFALLAYYLLKTTREPLVLATGGAMLKSVSTGVQAMVLLLLLPLHARLASRWSARALVRASGLVLLGGIVFFGLVAPFRPPGLGAAFYVFTGIFGVGAIAELGALLTDLVDPAHARRVLPTAIVGATLGGMVGSSLASVLFESGLRTSGLLFVAALAFAVHLGFVEWLGQVASEAPRSGFDETPISARDGFALVFSSPSLRAFALLVLVANLINTNGELVLGERVTSAARASFDSLAAGTGLDQGAYLEREIGTFYGRFFTGVNLATVVLQLLFAGALARAGGARWLLLVPAFVSLGVYAVAGIGAALSVFHAAKTIENASDYSFGATGRTLAWVETTREAKLAAKPVIDTFVVRVGDLFAAGTIAIGTALGLGATAFAWMNVGLALAAVALVVLVTMPRDARGRDVALARRAS